MVVLWPLLVLAAIIGWGSVGSRLVRRVGDVELRRFSDRLGLGIAVTVALLGVALLTGVIRFAGVIVLAGAAVGLAELIAYLRATPSWRSRPALVTTGLGALVVTAFGLYAASRSAHFSWMVCDDPTYLYITERLLHPGDLTDPSNLRRVQSLGGMSGLQALYLTQLGNRFLPFADYFLGSTLVLTTLWRTRQGRWSVWGIGAAVVVAVAYPTLTGLDFNTSPVVLPAGLVLLAMRYLILLRSEDHTTRATISLAAVIGLLTAAGMTLRPQFGQPLVVFILVVAAWPPFHRMIWYRLGGFAIGGAIGLSGWSLASWRDVGTPLFPLLSGNADPSFPALGDRLEPITIAKLASRVVDGLVSPPWLVMLVVGAVVIVVNRRLRRREPRYYGAATTVFGVGLGICLLWLVATTILGWNFGTPSHFLITRYFAPLFLAVALSPLAIVNAGPVADRVSNRSSLVVFATIAIVIGWCSIRVPEHLDTAWIDLTSGRLPSEIQTDEFGSKVPAYDQALALVPDGAKVLSAVDHPHALLSHEGTMHALDLVGFASPPPRLPYFQGDQAKTDWLKARGYQYLIAMAPNTSICNYNDKQFQEGARKPELKAWAEPWAAWVHDWSEYVDHLRRQNGATTVNDIVVVPIR